MATTILSGAQVSPSGDPGPVGPAGQSPTTPLADTTQNGLLKKVSGLTTDFVDGSNNCQDLVSAVQTVI
jgi:hypothetical protein